MINCHRPYALMVDCYPNSPRSHILVYAALTQWLQGSAMRIVSARWTSEHSGGLALAALTSYRYTKILERINL